ncbi:hypothetical protein UFOVP431_105 [uncultured Caudovirales phage]|uniref:Uncharacterized protein n=1 Tax=uncultured Caudovirales phage TaxID=2100421 RepID=A0A6J5MN77_9CAUD|nr:hypothetical protein UFOVP431_105 [uncultured Caudovirales phage]
MEDLTRIDNLRLRCQPCLSPAVLVIPGGDLGGPTLQVGPHQIAEMANFVLGIELGPQVEEVQEGPQAEAHHEVLAVVERQATTSLLEWFTVGYSVGVVLSGGLAASEILLAEFKGVIVNASVIWVAILPHRA